MSGLKNNQEKERKNVNKWGRQRLTFKEDSDLAFAKRQMKVECPYCKHLIGFYAFETRDKKLCDYCKNYVFKNKEAEFKYRMKQFLK